MQVVALIEDNLADIRQATAVLERLGVKHVHTITTVSFAMEFLREIVEERGDRPDLVILDLNFGKESGFEVLRYWKSSKELRDLPVIVWTIMGELEKNIATMFGVHDVVDKAGGQEALERAVQQVSALGRHSSVD